MDKLVVDLLQQKGLGSWKVLKIISRWKRNRTDVLTTECLWIATSSLTEQIISQCKRNRTDLLTTECLWIATSSLTKQSDITFVVAFFLVCVVWRLTKQSDITFVVANLIFSLCGLTCSPYLCQRHRFYSGSYSPNCWRGNLHLCRHQETHCTG